MADFMHHVVDNYNDLIKSKQDTMVDSWLFMKSPMPVITILACYLYFVLRLGPQWMVKRKAYDLQTLLVLYNAYQVVFSVWLCCQAMRVDLFTYFWKNGCRASLNKSEFAIDLHKGAWWYFFSKIVELLDTVFFVLRKKQSQVTFLHVYHHSITALFSWGYLKFLPGEQGVVIGFLNSFVHIFMYFYYMVAAMGPKYQKYLWWKRYMTWIQLIQFGIMLAFLLTTVLMDCKMPKALTLFFATNALIFLYLFSDFYRKAYRKRGEKLTTIRQEECFQSGKSHGNVPASCLVRAKCQ